MPLSLRIGRISGIDIEIHISWLIVFLLLTMTISYGIFPRDVPGLPVAIYWIAGAATSLLLFVSVLLHELAHSLVARRNGLPIHSITLFIFGGVSNLEREPGSAGMEFKMAIAGPLASIIIGVLLTALYIFLINLNRLAGATIIYLGISNILLGIFNLIPGFPLDGGRVLRSALWKMTHNFEAATKIAMAVGKVIAYLFFLAGIVDFILGSFVSGIWLGFIGWFLLGAAELARKEVKLDQLLSGISAGEVMNSSPFSVSPDISIQELADKYMLLHDMKVVPVAQQQQLVGAITIENVRSIKQEYWPQTHVNSIMTPLAQICTVPPQQKINDILLTMASRNIKQAFITDNGQIIGTLDRGSVILFLEIKRGLSLQEAEQLIMQRLPKDA